MLFSSNVPPLPQCLPLDATNLGNQKYTLSGELRQVFGVVAFGSTSEAYAFGVSYVKPPPPVAIEELMSFKDTVQYSSGKARDGAQMLCESIHKLDKYREAMLEEVARK